MLLLRLLTVAAAGAGVMYLLDPDGGQRRRARVRDGLVRAAHRTGDAVDATSRDVGHRARGVVAELRSRLVNVEVSDGVLYERVRARIGSVVGQSGAVEATVVDGRVSLRGPVLADDVDRLVRRVRSVPGVREVIDQLDVHDDPGGIPGLQRRPRPQRGGEVFELLQTRWSPTARLFATLAGATMVLWGVRRLDLPGIALVTAGVALLVRGLGRQPRAGLSALARGRL
jgi:osmotically-inducible protein OsmY